MAPVAAVAAPSVSVTASVPNTLLGDKTTVRVTVTNNTSDTAITGKGYNLDIGASFDSSLTSAAGKVTFVSASGGGGAQVPTINTIDAVTGIRTLGFSNIQDLAPGESLTLDIVLDTAGDPTWEVGQQILGAFTATLYDAPNGTGPRVGSTTANGTIIPLILTKDANQSTAIDQASGTQTRTFTHTVKVQNNYVRPSSSIVLTDVIPDGLEYLGMVSGPAPDGGFPTTNTATGVKTLQWTIGTLLAGQSTTIVYRTGIRYDWYGTNNGGTNRQHDSSATPTGTPIPNHTTLTNTATVGALYKGSLPTTIALNYTDTATVKTAYVTLDKTGGPATVGYGDTVNFSLNVYASQYYSSDGILIRDFLPDGLTYTPGSASIAPSSVVPNADGTTLLTWGPSQLGTLPASGNMTITIAATVDTTWQGAGGPAGEPIRANDGFSNRAEFDGTWHDQYNPARNLAETIINQASVPMSTGLPQISKDVYNPLTATWSKAASATVGDKLTFRVRFNTGDGATPLRNNITMGYTELTDWLPSGLAYNGDAAILRSPDASFSVPTTGTPRPLNLTTATAVNLGGLDGVQWFLGDVGPGAWWQATFSVTVTNTASVQDGVVDTNYWKLTGLDTQGQTYSKRDASTVTYKTPGLNLTKSVAALPTYMLPGQPTTYTISITNTSTVAAQNVSVVDTLPVGMRSSTPTVTSVVLNGVPLVLNVGYKLSPAYNPATGLLAVDLYDTSAPSVNTSIPGGQTLVITYLATPDQGVAAGSSFINTASVGYSTTISVGGRYTTPTVNPADPNTDIATKQVQPLTILKAVEGTSTYTVGDIVSYNMTATVPTGTVAYWPVMRDAFNRDGVSYVASSSALVTVSGTPVTGASFATSAADPAVVTTTGTPVTTVRWDLNTIDNSGTASAYVYALKFKVQYTGFLDTGAWEMGPTNAGATTNSLINTGTVAWGSRNLGPGATDQTATAAPVTVNIAQPRLINSKAVITPGPYSGGMPISYETTFNNTGTWPAYQVAWEDRLPSQLGTATLQYVRHSVLGTLVAGTDYTTNFSSLPTLTISFASSITVPVGTNIKVGYTTSLVPTTGAGAQLTNTSDVDWYSRPTTAPPTRYYQEPTDTITNDTRSVTIPIQFASALSKSIISTPNPSIGDIVTYRARFSIPPETILYQNPYVLDSLTTTGVAYISNSATTTAVSGSPVTSATISSVTTNGTSVRFNLGPTVSNASTLSPQGDSAYVFDLTFQARVTGRLNSGVETWAPTGAVTSTDTVALDWNDSASAGTNRSSNTATAAISIRRPRLSTSKSFSAAVMPASDS